jgi:putative DNA primase/helicase
VAGLASNRRRTTDSRGALKVAISFSYSEVRAYCAARLPQLQERGEERRGPCPLHKGARDSFALNAQTGFWTCHACDRGGDLIQFEREVTGADFKTAHAEVLRLTGRPEAVNGDGSRRSSIVAEYDYQDGSGRVLYQTVRFDPKSFKQRRPNGSGEWIWNLKDVRLILYRLPELMKRTGDIVFVCEGEKDIHALEGLGLLATCNPMGAGKWRASYAETLRGRRIVIITDTHAAGRIWE